MAEAGEIRQLRVDIPADVYEWFKIAAVKRRTTLRALVIEALEAYRRQQEGGKPGGTQAQPSQR